MRPADSDPSVRDSPAARRFFEAALGWRCPPHPAMPGYYRIEAGADGEPGIDLQADPDAT